MNPIKSTAAQSLLFMITASELLGRGEGVEVLNPGPVLHSSFNFIPLPTHHLERRNVDAQGAANVFLLVSLLFCVCSVSASIYFLCNADPDDESVGNDDSLTSASYSDDSSNCVYFNVNTIPVGKLEHSESTDSSFLDCNSYDAAIDIPDGVPVEIIAVEEIESDEEQGGYRP